MNDVMTANVRCTSCDWEGPVDDARTDNTHTVGSTTVREYRCPVCGGRVAMDVSPP